MTNVSHTGGFTDDTQELHVSFEINVNTPAFCIMVWDTMSENHKKLMSHLNYAWIN